MIENTEHKKHTPRPQAEVKMLKNRLHRMMGQLTGIEKMLDEGRYCKEEDPDVMEEVMMLVKKLK